MKDMVIAGGVSFMSYTASYNDDNGHGTLSWHYRGEKQQHWGNWRCPNHFF